MFRRLLFYAMTFLLGFLSALTGPLHPFIPYSPYKVITIAATASPHAEILYFIRPQLAAKGIDLQIVITDDYLGANIKVASQQYDGNFFQPRPYLERLRQERSLPLTELTAVHVEPLGIYSKQPLSLAALPDNSAIALPADPHNLGRALRLLARSGLISLQPGITAIAALEDVADNPRHLRLIPVAAHKLPRVFPEVTLAVMPAYDALAAKLSPLSDALLLEDGTSSYVHVLAIHTSSADRPEMAELAAALNTPGLQEFIAENYQGRLIPAF